MKNIHGRKMLNFSVNRQLQLRLLVKVLGIVVVGAGIMAAVFYYYSNREISESYRQFHVQAKNFLDYLLPAVISSLLISVVAAVIITLFLPQRIAGPLYRIEKDLTDRISTGDLTVKVTLRKGDDVTNLANALNETISTLRGKVENVSRPALELQSRLNTMDGKADTEIAALSKQINEALKGFKI